MSTHNICFHGEIRKNTKILKLLAEKKKQQHMYMYMCIYMYIIAPDIRWYQVNIFLISPQKHMVWVLFRSTSTMCFY